MARYDDLNTRAIAYTTLVSTVLLLIIILLGRAMCYSWINDQDEKKLGQASYTASDNAIEEQKSVLAKYEKVKVEVAPPDGVAPATDAQGQPMVATEERIHIPIDDAKQVLLRELSEQQTPTT